MKLANLPKQVGLPLETYQSWVGQRLQKHSGKPFKSGAKAAMAVAVVPNPEHPKSAYAFEFVDFSHGGTYLVDCHQCILVSEYEAAFEAEIDALAKKLRKAGMQYEANLVEALVQKLTGA